MTTRTTKALRRRVSALGTINSPGEAFAHLRIFLIASAITVILRLRLSKPLLKWLGSIETGKVAPDSDRLQQIVRRTDTVLLLGRPAIRSECLARTCLLYYQMKRAGAVVNMRFGAAMNGTRLRAHCWLLVDGEPNYEQFDPRPTFQKLYDLHG